MHIVLDTNVLLDWLVFRDPRVVHVSASIASGSTRWICTRAMQDEFDDVINREAIRAWSPDGRTIAEAWTKWAVIVDTPTVSACYKCSDPDDQKFVDLALAAGASALLTRDRALLRLHARTRALGLAIVRPERWTPLP